MKAWPPGKRDARRHAPSASVWWAVLAFACAVPSLAGAQNPAASRGQTLILGRADDMVSLDPAATTRMADFLPITLAYEQLTNVVVRNGRPTGELRGGLASRWTTSADGLTWTFVLRRGHRFDDGSVVDARAVKTSFDRLRALGRGPAQALDAVAAVAAPTPETVVFTLRRPFTVLGQILALPMFGVVNPTVLAHARNGDAGSAWLSQTSAGSGSYRVRQWSRAQFLALDANPWAARTPLYFREVRIQVIKDVVSRAAQLRRGDIDVLLAPPAELAPQLKRMPGVRVVSGPSATLFYLELNNARPPFNARPLRAAVAAAIDRPAIVAGVFQGLAHPVGGVLPPGMPGAETAAPQQRRDLRLARQQLKAAHFSRSGALKLSYVPGDPALEAIAVVTQAYLAEIGMTVRLEPLTASAFNDKVRFRGDYDMALRVYAADFADPWIVLDPVYASKNRGPAGNVSRYANAHTDAVLASAETTPDPSARADLYRQASAQIVQDMPHVVLLSPDGVLAYRSDLTGVRVNFWQPQILDAAAMGRAPFRKPTP